MKPKIIHIPRERPYVCAECPLLARRPRYEIPPCDKYTMRCFLPEHEQNVSGRGSKQPNARFRCSKRVYDKVFVTFSGDIPVSANDYEKYQMGLDSWLFERDRRIYLENYEKTKTIHR